MSTRVGAAGSVDDCESAPLDFRPMPSYNEVTLAQTHSQWLFLRIFSRIENQALVVSLHEVLFYSHSRRRPWECLGGTRKLSWKSRALHALSPLVL